MKKKVFENGTLKSKAYFMNGETKQEIEEAVWEGTTPLSAENLNGMQDNIEEETEEDDDIFYDKDDETDDVAEDALADLVVGDDIDESNL